MCFAPASDRASRMSDESFFSGPEHKAGKFPVLTSTNFTEWLDLAEDVLLSRGLWRYASGDVAEPTDPDGKIAFQKEDAKAVAFLKSAAGTEQRAHLIGLKSSRQVLDKLKAVNQVSQQERVQRLLSDFHGFRALDTIDTSASRLTQLQVEIAVAEPEEKPSDTSKKAVLIQSLTEDYQSTVFALKAAGLSRMSFDDVVQRLKEVESSIGSKPEESLARIAKGTREQNDDAQRKGALGRCYYCNKKGHFKNACRKLRADLGQARQGGHPYQGRLEEGVREEVHAAWTASYDAKLVRGRGYAGPECQDWILDSGCTRHMTYDRGHFIEFENHGGKVTIADGTSLEVQGGGTIEVPIQGKTTKIVGVIYVPRLGYNLLSISQLADRRVACRFDGSIAVLSRNGVTMATATRRGKSYVLGPRVMESDAAVMAQDTLPGEGQSRLWHRRLGHPGDRKLQATKEAVNGLPSALTSLQEICETCETTKSTTKGNKHSAVRASIPLERIHMDFWGPYKHLTPGGNRFMLTITDDFSRKSWIFLTKARSGVYDAFTAWRARAELESRQSLRSIRIDNAPEFVKLGQRLETEGVRIERTVPYTPSQNGVAERLNRTLVTKARTMLAAAELPKELWGEAVHAACYLKNRIPTGGAQTPEERWSGTKPGVSHLRVFGCVAYAHTATSTREKFDKTSHKGVFVGYSETARQYRILNPSDNTVGLFSSVRFDESSKGGLLFADQCQRYQRSIPMSDAVFDAEEEHDVHDDQQRPATSDSQSDDDDRSEIVGQEQPRPNRETGPSEQPVADQQPVEKTSRSGRRIRLPTRFRDEDRDGSALAVDYKPTSMIRTPLNFEEATECGQAREWKLAIEEQLQSLAANHTWDVIDKPPGGNVITPKWVFKIKTLPNGQVDKFKARLVARGFTQQYGVDYFETFAPVVRLESLRVLLATAVMRGLEVHQMDAVSAYLLSELTEDAYMHPPEGLDVPQGKVLKLRKCMPGLKQSGRIWNKTITAFFEEFGLRNVPADQSVFVNDERTLIVALYVDDMVIFAPSVEAMKPLKQALARRFEMKDLGEAKLILGIRITRDREAGSMTLDQTHYVKDVIEEQNVRTGAHTPADGYGRLTAREKTETVAGVQAYQALLGKLNWIVRGTRPDIAFAVQKLSQCAHAPTTRHMEGAWHVLRYLNRHETFAITYARRQDSNLVGYADADFAADASRRSTMGYIFSLAGGAVSWSSKLQRSVSTSTTEAEYLALGHAAKEAVWLRNFLAQIGCPELQTETTSVYGDNQGAIALVKNPEFHARTKHIDVSAHFIRELEADKVIRLGYISSDRMRADCLTKPLKRISHERNVKDMGLAS